LAVVGAGGLVGRRVVKDLSRKDIPGLELAAFGHGKSIGTALDFRGETLVVERTSIEKLKRMDLAVLCTPAPASKELVSELRGGPIIVDTSSAFRMDPDVPLVVPEVNPESLAGHKGLIAGPNCSTIQLVIALCPVKRRYGLERVHVATYQSVSGVGYQAMVQLEEESLQKLSSRSYSHGDYESQFPHPIAFNVIPQIDSFLPGGYTKEEMKMVNETRKILGQEDLLISCTCVRVPVFIGHAEDCLVETREKADLAEFRDALKAFPGVKLLDDPSAGVYPMPIAAEGTDDVYVGRIRRDLGSENGVLFWVVADNLLRGAATNACNVVRSLLLR
jgi:aspartate-semialdehyde dehydrogenase